MAIRYELLHGAIMESFPIRARLCVYPICSAHVNGVQPQPSRDDTHEEWANFEGLTTSTPPHQGPEYGRGLAVLTPNLCP